MAGRIAETKIDILKGAEEMEDVHVCVCSLSSQIELGISKCQIHNYVG